jgi:hypothetical protein
MPEPVDLKQEDYLRREIRKHSRRLFKLITAERKLRCEAPAPILSHEAVELLKAVNGLILLRAGRLAKERRSPGESHGEFLEG